MSLLCTELPEHKRLRFQGRHCKRPRRQIRSTVPLPASSLLPQTLMHIRVFALVPILQPPQRQGVIRATGPADLHPPSACNRGLMGGAPPPAPLAGTQRGLQIQCLQCHSSQKPRKLLCGYGQTGSKVYMVGKRPRPRIKNKFEGLIPDLKT